MSYFTKFSLVTLLLITTACTTDSDTTKDLSQNNAGRVVISGITTVGQTLMATVNDADGIASSTISYVWKAGDTTIDGATDNTHLLSQAEKGRRITVAASYIDDGFTAESLVSVPTIAVSALISETGNFCEPLAAPTDNIVRASVADVNNLDTIVSSLNTGDTLLLEDGVYQLNGTSLRFRTAGVTLRSASGNPDGVILDGGYDTNTIVSVSASDVTIAEITIKRAFHHPIHVTSSNSGDTLNTLVYRATIIDPRQQAIKINQGFNSNFSDNGEIACSTLKLTVQGRSQVDNATMDCYTGGIDVHRSRGWVVRDNLIEGFWCPVGLSQHAIHFWTGSRDTVVKRNVILNNARGIGFGLLSTGTSRTPRTYQDNACSVPSDEYVGHYGGIIKNNFIIATDSGLLGTGSGFACGVCLWSSCDTTVVHNTVYSAGHNNSSIEYRFPATTNTKIYNNLLSHTIRKRNNASADIRGNLEHVSSETFVNIGSGDLHIKANLPSVIDQGCTQCSGIGFDIDGDARDSLPDIGADEFL